MAGKRPAYRCAFWRSETEPVSPKPSYEPGSGTGFSDIRTMPRRDRLTASYRSGVRFVGLMFPAPPWMMSRGLIMGEDCGRLYSMFIGACT